MGERESGEDGVGVVGEVIRDEEMRIVSRIRSKSFLKFTLFEHAIITTLIGAGIPAMLFFGIMMSGRRNSDSAVELIETFFADEGTKLMAVVAIVAAIVNLIVLGIRNSEMVVLAELDDARKSLKLEVRRRRTRTLRSVEVPFERLVWRRTKTAKIPAVPSYIGYEFLDGATVVGSLLTDHFTWDDQQRRVKSFLAELNERVVVGG